MQPSIEPLGDSITVHEPKIPGEFCQVLIKDARIEKVHADCLECGAKSLIQIGIANRYNLLPARLARERDAAMQVGGDPDRAGRILTLAAEKRAAIEAFAKSELKIGG